MNETGLEKRQARAAKETLVIAPTGGGFRVYKIPPHQAASRRVCLRLSELILTASAAITKIYMVTGALDSLTCNCPDFEVHKSDPN